MNNGRSPLIRILGLGLIIAGAISCAPQPTAIPEILPTSMIESTITPKPASASEDSSITLYRGNSQRTGIYNVQAIRQQPETKWQVKISSTWLMPAMFADGMLYTGSGDGTLYALNGETGEQVWSVGGFGQLELTGAIADDRIIAGGYSKLVKALDRKTGGELWTYATEYVIQGSPLIIDNRVCIATDHTVYALDLASGQLVWKVPTGTEDAFMGAPAYDEGMIYTTGGKLLLALDAQTGKEIWRVDKGEIFLGLAVANGLVYVGNWDQNFYAFDQSTGEERWSFKGGNIFWSSPAVDENMVYAGNIDKNLYALNAQTGELRWSFETAGDAVSEPLVADGVVYVSDSSHETRLGPRHLYALDAATGEQLWVFETTSTFLPAPALGENIIYVTTTGEVFALKPSGQ